MAVIAFITLVPIAFYIHSQNASAAEQPDLTEERPWNALSGLFREELPPDSLQFQFLIGDWHVIAQRFDPRSGELLAEVVVEQHVEYRNNKRMLFEEWAAYSPASGYQVSYGVTLRTYSEAVDHWQVVYFASHQPSPASTYRMHQHDGEMHGRGEFEDPSAGTVMYKTRFFNITAESYEWEQKYSLDGENWFLERTQRATRDTSVEVSPF